MNWMLGSARPFAVVALGLTLVASGSSFGQESKLAEGKEVKPPEPKALVLSPAPAPLPAMRYRLLPLSSELNPGDAAPVYLRLMHERTPEGIRAIRENSTTWTDKPLADFPLAEARSFVNQWQGALEQIRFGAFRQSCDWAYTLPEQRDRSIEILLPDAQSLRQVWARLVTLRLRVEVAENRFDDAAQTAEVGLSFARHLGGGPFLINGLVGIAVAGGVMDRLEEFVAQPGAPNLYWALSSLPDPLIPLRGALDQEQLFVENMVPELAGHDLPKTDVEWAARAVRLNDHLNSLKRTLREYEKDKADRLADLSLADFRTAVLALADHDTRRAEAAGIKPAMGEAERICRFAALLHREIRDEVFKASYLPLQEGGPTVAAALERIQEFKNGPLGVVAEMMPSVVAARQSETKLVRRVAALRVVEAIRMHAAAHGGKLPETLEAVTIVPVPLDPTTGKPFGYRRDGDAAILSSPPLTGTAVLYRISIRP